MKIRNSILLLLVTSTLFFTSCNSTKKQIEAAKDYPCEEVLKEHFVVNTNGYNITKLEQEGNKLYIFGQVSGCSQGSLSAMWEGAIVKSMPPKVTLDFKSYDAGLCDMMVNCIWCIDLSRFREVGSEVELHIASTQNSILLEF